MEIVLFNKPAILGIFFVIFLISLHLTVNKIADD